MRCLTGAVVALLLCVATDVARADEPYSQTKNIVYGESNGVGLVLDVFTPTGDKNGLGIVLVASGGWRSGRDLVNRFVAGDVPAQFCEAGYTVFAVSSGSIPKFSANDMVHHLRMAIRWIKARAGEYAIDPERLGMYGASAGGHLTLLTSATAGDDTRVRAAVAIFPPTDFLDYGGKPLDLASGKDDVGKMVRALLVPEGIEKVSAEDVEKRMSEASPVRNVTDKTPPVLLVHGTNDALVPLQQSELMKTTLEKAGITVRLDVIEGGEHTPELITEAIPATIEWFDKYLRESAAPAAVPAGN